ncbi:MAG TPA: glycosyltransferase, partial [Burkholderiales bacterium]|nr:glycosyltransferase [Burkholderiales bacterium]
QKLYRREAEVIHPPVDTAQLSPSGQREDFYLCLGQLVRYKRVDLAVEAFNRLGLPLVVIGEGECMDDLRKIANENVKFLGRQPFDAVKDHLERCQALVFPGVEDFGIVPVEAMAAGAPVIAFAGGGALETVIDGETGILFRIQSVESLADAVTKLESGEVVFDASRLQNHARRFDISVFRESMRKFIEEKLDS